MLAVREKNPITWDAVINLKNPILPGRTSQCASPRVTLQSTDSQPTVSASATIFTPNIRYVHWHCIALHPQNPILY